MITLTNPSRFTWKRKDFEAEQMLHAYNDLRDQGIYEHDENAMQQVISNVFGFGHNHTFSEAIGVTMCDTIGCPDVEYLLGLGFFDRLSKIEEMKLNELQFNHETLEWTCPRCKRVQQL